MYDEIMEEFKRAYKDMTPEQMMLYYPKIEGYKFLSEYDKEELKHYIRSIVKKNTTI